MKTRQCDICGRTHNWLTKLNFEYKRKWNIFKKDEYEAFEIFPHKLDVCESCHGEMIQYIKDKLTPKKPINALAKVKERLEDNA